MPIDPNFFYSLSTQFLGEDWLLECGPTTADEPVGERCRMVAAKGSPLPSQVWRFTEEDGAFRLSNEYAGTGWYLTANALREGVTLQPRSEANFPLQLWTVTEQIDDFVELRPLAINGAWFESNHPKTGKALVDGRPLPLVMDNTAMPMGQRWMLKFAREVPPPSTVKPVMKVGTSTYGETGAFAALDATVTARVVFVDLGKESPDPNDATALVVTSPEPELASRVEDAKSVLINESVSAVEFTKLAMGRASLVLSYDTRVVHGKRDSFSTPDSWLDSQSFANSVISTLDTDADARNTTGTSGTKVAKTSDSDVVVICLLRDGENTLQTGMSRRVKPRTVIMAASAYEDDYRIFLHELGHTFSLPDLYPLKNDGHKVGPWDLMADARLATSMVGWHRLRAGWLDPSSPRIAQIDTPTSATVQRFVLVPWSFSTGIASIIVQPPNDGSVEQTWGIELSNEVKGRAYSDHTSKKMKKMTKDEGVGVVVYRVVATPAADRRQLEVVSAGVVSTDNEMSKWDLFNNGLLKQGTALVLGDGLFTVKMVGPILGKGFEIEVAAVPATKP